MFSVPSKVTSLCAGSPMQQSQLTASGCCNLSVVVINIMMTFVANSSFVVSDPAAPASRTL